MAELWVVVDHEKGEPKKVSLQMLSAGRRIGEKLGHDLVAVFAGTGFDAAKEKLAKYGASKVLVAEGEDLEGYLVQPGVDLLTKLVQ
jgi:electron transfer flavoprotein alpha subunit